MDVERRSVALHDRRRIRGRVFLLVRIFGLVADTAFHARDRTLAAAVDQILLGEINFEPVAKEYLGLDMAKVGERPTRTCLGSDS